MINDIESDLLCQIASRMGALQYLCRHSMISKLLADDFWVGDMRVLIQEIEGLRFKLKRERDKLAEEIRE